MKVGQEVAVCPTPPFAGLGFEKNKVPELIIHVTYDLEAYGFADYLSIA